MDTVILELFGQDPKVKKAISIARNVSVTKAPVLIVGEAGVGKRTLSNLIHDYSTRAAQKMQVIDCSMSPEEVENSILGHRDDESGRFHKGILEIANKGTVVFANVDNHSSINYQMWRRHSFFLSVFKTAIFLPKINDLSHSCTK